MKQKKTMARLVDIKRKNAEGAEAAHAGACATTKAAGETHERAERAWLAAIERHDGIGSAADLEERDGHARSLRRAADAAQRALQVARQRETETRAAMTEARIELRRFETWIERESARQASEERRTERIAEDEVAARKWSVA